MINCMEAWNYLQKSLDLPLSTETIRQAHGLMMEDEKDVLVEEYRKSPAFVGYHIFAPAVIFKDTWKAQFLVFKKLKNMIWL